jgi:hypothetical protein
MHRIVATNFIGTQESVYGDSEVGKLSEDAPISIDYTEDAYINLLKGSNFPVKVDLCAKPNHWKVTLPSALKASRR